MPLTRLHVVRLLPSQIAIPHMVDLDVVRIFTAFKRGACMASIPTTREPAGGGGKHETLTDKGMPE